jgi:hypothetical protein
VEKLPFTVCQYARFYGNVTPTAAGTGGFWNVLGLFWAHKNLAVSGVIAVWCNLTNRLNPAQAMQGLT